MQEVFFFCVCRARIGAGRSRRSAGGRTTAGREGKPRKAGLLYVCAPKIAAEQVKKRLPVCLFFYIILL